MHFLGLDIGTSAVKGVVVDAAQTLVASASAPIATASPRAGWYEQDPAAWSTATERVVADLRAAAPTAFTGIHAIGLSGQMHGAVVLGDNHQPLRPAILWNDGRATAECVALAQAVPDIATIAGVVPMPGFTAPKLLWLQRHEPEVFARVRHVLLAKDVIRLRLTGETATDMVDGAGTLMLDEARRVWSEPIMAAVGVDPAAMPTLLEGSAVSGLLRAEVAAAWGIERPVLVAAGAGDIGAGALGVGAIEDGDAFISLGTSAQIFVARNRYAPRPATLLHSFAHALPARWFEMAALLNGAAPLDWIARVFGASPSELLAEAERAFRKPSPVTFLPYLAGERTPHNDPGARGAFAHLEYVNGTTDLVQAVLDGVALSLKEGINTLGQAIGGESIPLIGGGARSLFWMKLIASAIGRPLEQVAGADTGPAFGAARLARLALTGEPPAAVCTKPRAIAVIEPDAALADAYAARFPAFQALTASLRRVRDATADRHPAATR